MLNDFLLIDESQLEDWMVSIMQKPVGTQREEPALLLVLGVWAKECSYFSEKNARSHGLAPR
jgi:hypothetical protein